MFAELGLLAAILALMLAILQGALPLWGAFRERETWMMAAIPLAAAQFLFLATALTFLALLFAQNDFSVLYVANNSNTELPLGYRLSAVWGGHEGSLLLWTWMLSAWAAAVAIFSRRMPTILRARILGILGVISSGFLAFMLFTSNPFVRLLPPPVQGRDLNPLLQDPGLAIHPPMLYMGYVGFSVVFAFAVAALLGGKMDSAWAKYARPWTLMAWMFLTLGIMLGSWWAYYELGWGGWWFWDPVENASFMPWLAGTALLHSLACTEARGIFKPWTALLAILTFSLCLLGTFLVRSGVLTSVHAFATDPARGAFILLLLSIIVGGALLLYGMRAQTLRGNAQFAPISRESGILINNIFLTAATVGVLIGTLYPLILESAGGGKISVGPPYYNIVFVPLAVVPAAMAVVGALSRYKSDTAMRLFATLRPALIAALLTAFLLPLLASGDYQWTAVPGLTLACWILFGTLTTAIMRYKNIGRANGGFWGMIIAHSGIAIFVAGITLVGVYENEKDVRLMVGEPQTIGAHVFELQRLYESPGENYDAIAAEIHVRQNQREVAILHPQKRRYFSNPENAMTEAGIAAKLNGDLYASLGEPLGDGTWSARLQIKPFIRLIWGGAILMALGGLCAAVDRRYRR